MQQGEGVKNNAYLPQGLITPPRVKRHTLTCILAGDDVDYSQDHDGGGEEDSAYFPSGQFTSPIERIMRIPPLPLLCVNPKDEEQKDKNVANNWNITEEKHNHDQTYTSSKDKDIVSYNKLQPIPTAKSYIQLDAYF